MRQLCHMALIVVSMVILLSWAVPVANPTPTKPIDLHEAFTRQGDNVHDHHPPPIRKNGGVRGQSRLAPKKNKQSNEIVNQDLTESKEHSAEQRERVDESELELDNPELEDAEEEKPGTNALFNAASIEMERDNDQLEASIGDHVFGRVQGDDRTNSTDDKSTSTMNNTALDEVHIAGIIGNRIESEDKSEKSTAQEAQSVEKVIVAPKEEAASQSLTLNEHKAHTGSSELQQDSPNMQALTKDV